MTKLTDKQREALEAINRLGVAIYVRERTSPNYRIAGTKSIIATDRRGFSYRVHPSTFRVLLTKKFITSLAYNKYIITPVGKEALNE